MNDNLKNLIKSVIIIIVGLLFCILKAGLLNLLMTIFGIALIVGGILSIINKDYVEGAIYLGLGLFAILGGWLFLGILLIVLGVLLIIKGVSDLLAIKKKTLLNVAPCVVMIIFGALLILSKWLMFDLLFIILGIVLIANGVLTLIQKQPKRKNKRK